MNGIDTFEDLRIKIIQWGEDKGITKHGNERNQILKTFEELGELVRAELKDDRDEIIDSLGDVLVTLILYAETKGLDIVDCLESAWNVIKDRTGKKVNGIFIKDE